MKDRNELRRRLLFPSLLFLVSVTTAAAQSPPNLPSSFDRATKPAEPIESESATASNPPSGSPAVALKLTPVSDVELPSPAPPLEVEAGPNAEASASAEELNDRPEPALGVSLDPPPTNPEQPAEESAPATAGPNEPAGESVILEPEDDGLGERLEKILGLNQTSLSWVVRGEGTDGIGFLSYESVPAWEFPFGRVEGFEFEFFSGIHWLDGPGRTDLPPRLFDFSLNVHFWDPEFIQIDGEPPIGIEARFDLGLHADFQDSLREGWRFPGRVLFIQETSPDFRWVAGFEYLDLDHIRILPAGGFVLRTPDVEVDLYFPRPKLRIRMEQHDSHDEWLYVIGEYRGRGWAIKRWTTGLEDVVTLSEYRLGVGWEHEPTRRDEDDDGDNTPRVGFFEVSWLFGRDLEYRSGVGNYQPHDTVMFRVGSRY